MSADSSSIFIRTEPTHDGAGFAVVVEIDNDRSYHLDPAAQLAHAQTLLKACAFAEYDAAVYRQMTVRFPADTAWSIVRDLQNDRAPFDPGSTSPFRYLPGLTREAREPVIQMSVENSPIGILSMHEARGHAVALLEAGTVAELDSDYLRLMRGTIGLDEPTARAVVGELAEHRP